MYVGHDRWARTADRAARNQRMESNDPNDVSLTEVLSRRNWNTSSPSTWNRDNIRRTSKARRNGIPRQTSHANGPRPYEAPSFPNNSDNYDQPAAQQRPNGIDGGGDELSSGRSDVPLNNDARRASEAHVKKVKRRGTQEQIATPGHSEKWTERHPMEDVNIIRPPSQDHPVHPVNYDQEWGHSGYTPIENTAENMFPGSIRPHSRQATQQARNNRQSPRHNVPPWSNANSTAMPPPQFLGGSRNDNESHGGQPSAVDSQSIMGTNSAFGAFDFGGFGADRQSLSTSAGAPLSALPKSEKSFPGIEEEYHMANIQQPELVGNSAHPPAPFNRHYVPGMNANTQPGLVSKDPRQIKHSTDKPHINSDPDTESEEDNRAAKSWGGEDGVTSDESEGEAHKDAASMHRSLGHGTSRNASYVSMDDEHVNSQAEEPVNVRTSGSQTVPAVRPTPMVPQAVNQSSSSEEEEPAGGIWGLLGATRKKKKEKSAPSRFQDAPSEHDGNNAGDFSQASTDQKKNSFGSTANAFARSPPPDEGPPFEGDSRYGSSFNDKVQPSMEQVGRNDVRSHSRATQGSSPHWPDMDAPPAGVSYDNDQSLHNYTTTRPGPRASATDLNQRKKQPFTFDVNQVSPPSSQRPLSYDSKIAPREPWENPWQSTFHQQDDVLPHAPNNERSTPVTQPFFQVSVHNDKQKPRIQKLPVRTKSKLRLRQPVAEPPKSDRPSVSQLKPATPEIVKQGSVNTIDRESLKNSDRPSTQSRDVLPNPWASEAEEEQPQPVTSGEPLNIINIHNAKGTPPSIRRDPALNGKPGQSIPEVNDRVVASPDNIPLIPQKSSRTEPRERGLSSSPGIDPELGTWLQSKARPAALKGGTISRKHRPGLPMDANPRTVSKQEEWANNSVEEEPPVLGDSHFPLAKAKPSSRRPAAFETRRKEASPASTSRYSTNDTPVQYHQSPETGGSISRPRHARDDVERIPRKDADKRASRETPELNSRPYSQQSSTMPPEQLRLATRNTPDAALKNRSNQLADKRSPFAAKVFDTKSSQLPLATGYPAKNPSAPEGNRLEDSSYDDDVIDDAHNPQVQNVSPPPRNRPNDRANKTQLSAKKKLPSKQPTLANDRRPASRTLHPESREVTPEDWSDQDFKDVSEKKIRPHHAHDTFGDSHGIKSPPSRAHESRKPYQATVSEEDPDESANEGRRPVSEGEVDLSDARSPQPVRSSSRKARKRSRLTPSPIELNQHPRQRRRRSLAQAVDMSTPSKEDPNYSDDEAPRPATANKPYSNEPNGKQAVSPVHHGRHRHRPSVSKINNPNQARDAPKAKTSLASPDHKRDNAGGYLTEHGDEYPAQPRFAAAREHDNTERVTTPEQSGQQHSRPATQSSRAESEPKEITPKFGMDPRTNIESGDSQLTTETLDERPSSGRSSKNRKAEEPTAGAESKRPPSASAEPSASDKAPETKPPPSTGLIGSIWGLVKMGASQPKPSETSKAVPEAEEAISPEPSEVNEIDNEHTHTPGKQPHAEATADPMGNTPVEPLSNEMSSAKPIAKEPPPPENDDSPDLQPYANVGQHDSPAMTQPAVPSVPPSDESRRYRKAGDMPSAKKKRSMSRNRRYSRAAPDRIADQDLASLPTRPVRPTVAGDPLPSAETTAARKVEKNANNTPLKTRSQRKTSPNRAKGPSPYELRPPPNATNSSAYPRDGPPAKEEKARRTPAQPRWEASPKEPQKPQTIDSRPFLNAKTMALPQPPYPGSREASPRRRSVSTWELSDTGSESDEQDYASHQQPPQPPELAGHTPDVKPVHVSSDSESSHKKFSFKKPVAKYDSEPEYEPEVTQVEQPRSRAKPRAQPIRQQPSRRQVPYEREVHEPSQSDSYSSEEDVPEKKPEVVKPLVDVPIRKRGSRLTSDKPMPQESRPRKSFHTERPRPLVSDDEDGSSEEEKAYRRRKEVRRPERPRDSRRQSRRRERNRHSVPEISPTYPPEIENQPPRHKQDKMHKPLPRSPTQEQEPQKYEEPVVQQRPLQRTSTAPAPRMGGLLGSLWNNLRRPKVEEHDVRAASDDESHRGVERRVEVPRRTQSHRHKRPMSAGAMPAHKPEPEPEPEQEDLQELDAERVALEAKAERRAKRRLSREHHRLQQQKEERQADIRRQEAEMAQRQEEEEAQRRAERRVRRQSLKAQRLEEEELNRRQAQEREAHLEKSARMDRRRTQERAESVARSRRRRHSWAPDIEAIEPPRRRERDTLPERRPSRRSTHQHRSEDGGEHRHRHQREHHRDGKHRSSHSKHRRKEREPNPEPVYPSARRGGNDKTASWVESQHTDPPEPPPVVATVVDLPGGEGHTISSDEEVRRELRKQARRRKKYGDMTDEEIEMQRAKRRVEREHARNPEGNGHISDVLPGRMGKWLKRFSK